VEAMRNLYDAKIIQLIYPATDTENPVKSNLKSHLDSSFCIPDW